MGEVIITPDAKGDPQVPIDAMVAKPEAAQAQTPATPAAAPEGTPERPAWLPEKFATPEDMAKAYSELEKKQGGKHEDRQEGDQKPADQADADEAANKAVAAAGLDMTALGNKIIQKGDFGAEEYAALEKQGISQDMVKSYVAGRQALADQMVNRMHETVGGKEAFDNLLGWAGDDLSADEIAAFSNTIDNGTETARKMALQGLAARQKSEGAPNLLGGRRRDAGSSDVFRSNAELTKSMADPRCSRDPATAPMSWRNRPVPASYKENTHDRSKR